jgi:hypothetical protein
MLNVTLELSESVHRWLEATAAARGVSIEAVIVESLESKSGRTMTVADAIAATLADKRDLYERLAK